MIDRPPDRMPLWAYVVVNALVWALTATAWWATREGWFMGPPANVPRPGAGALLFFVPVAFALVSVFDYVASRSDRRGVASPTAGAAPRDATDSEHDA